MNAAAEKSVGPTAELPGSTFRTVASFLLFVHLFSLGVVVSSNWGPQSEPSQIRRDVRGKLLPLTAYLQLLHMDTGYNFYYTYGGELDIDHVMFAKAGPAAEEWRHDEADLRLPEAGLWPALRRRRLLRLNLAVASQIDNDAVESLLPRAAGDYALARMGAEETTIRYRGLLLQRPQDVRASDPIVADPYAEAKFRTVYEARVWQEDGKVQLLKTTLMEAAAQQTAPELSAPPTNP